MAPLTPFSIASSRDSSPRITAKPDSRSRKPPASVGRSPTVPLGSGATRASTSDTAFSSLIFRQVPSRNSLTLTTLRILLRYILAIFLAFSDTPTKQLAVCEDRSEPAPRPYADVQAHFQLSKIPPDSRWLVRGTFAPHNL